MSFFPMFIDLDGKNVLIVGGGNTALRKARILLEYGARIHVVAPHFVTGWEPSEYATMYERTFEDQDVQGMSIVVAATDRHDLNQHIATLCKEQNIPINCVDDPGNCSFIFPALIHKEPLSIGVSTGGSSPTAAGLLRDMIDDALPDRSDDILAFLGDVRPIVKNAIADNAARSAFLRHLTLLCFKNNAPLPHESLQELLNSFLQQSEHI